MAYKLQDLKIVPGGLNLAAPGDQVAPGDSLELTGFWPSSVGKLQQTKGWTGRNTTVGYVIHSVSEAETRVYYGADQFLYQINRDTGATPIDSDYDGHPLGLIGYQGFMWIANRAQMRKDDGEITSDWGTEVPSANPGTSTDTDGELPDGEYEYYVTFVDVDFNESNPSPAANVTLSGGDNGKVTITRPSATTPELILRWNVYRKSPATSVAYKLNFPTDLPYATTDYVDEGTAALQQTDDDLIGNGEEMEQDHNAPPNCRVLADKPFNNRLVMASSEEFPNRVWYTRSDQPAHVPEEQHVDIGADRGDDILAISVKKGYFIIYRKRSIWAHYGDFDDDNPRIEPLVPDKGILGARAWCSHSQGDFFAWKDGIYRLGDWASCISQRIAPLFQEFALENYALVNGQERDQCALGVNDDRLWFSYPDNVLYPEQEDPGEFCNQTMIYDLATERWFSRTFGFNCFYLGSDHFYGGADGNVYSLEDALSNNGAAIPLAYQSEYLDAGLPDHEKTWADLVIDHYTNSADLVVKIRTNKNRTGGGVDEFTVATLNSDSLTKETIPLVYPADYPTVAKRGKPVKAYNLSVRIEGGDIELPATEGFAYIDSPILVHYYVEARKGKTFDSGITNHGTADVKTVDVIEIDIDASEGDVDLVVSSDLPGGVMAARETVTISQTAGRQVVVLVLDDPVDGKLLRYQMSGDEEFQVYGFRARVLPIGVYLDGAQEEVWETEALTPAA